MRKHEKSLKDIGEFGLIRRIQRMMKTDASVAKGIGDDCAVMKMDGYTYMLLTCDMLIQGVDFTLRDAPFMIGRKALAVSLSDIAACAGLPRYALVSLGLPARTPLSIVDKIYQGMGELAKAYEVNIVGGDLSRNDKIVIDVSVTGYVEKKRLVLRSGARPGDILCVTGTLGGSIHGKHLSFEPRIRQARFLSEHYDLHAMIDISDGFTQDLFHILEQSNVGAVVYEDLLPWSSDAVSLTDVLSSGEDFELLFALPRKDARALLSYGKGMWCAVGEVVEKKYGARLVCGNGKEKKLHPRGYAHF